MTAQQYETCRRIWLAFFRHIFDGRHGIALVADLLRLENRKP